MKDENIGDQQISEGAHFLYSVLEFTAQCERASDEFLASESSEGLIKTHEHLGTLLSLLDRASSCWWGCGGGDHAAEMLVGRCCSYGMSVFKLARSGFYDESVALTRVVGEITNLAVLFTLDAALLRDWSMADEKTRRDKYSPVSVRRAIEEASFPVPVDQHRYRQLSSKAVHLAPNIPPQLYNAERHAKTGGYFQEVGLVFCLAEIGYLFSVLGPCTVGMCNLKAEQGERVLRASSLLSESLRTIRSRVNATFPGTYS